MKIKNETKEVLSALLNNSEAAKSFQLDPRVEKSLHNLTKESISIWENMANNFKRGEKLSEAPARLQDETKMYALDGLVVASQFSISKKKRRKVIESYCIYYLAVHLLDDIVDDPDKFYQKFDFSRNFPLDAQKKILGASFILQATSSFSHIFLDAPEFFSPEFSSRSTVLFSESLSRQIKYFTVQQDVIHPPEKILEIKQRFVAGEATSFIGDLLDLKNIIGDINASYLKKALWYLGSLTQFTDDLRDYEKDKANNNANLLISLEKFYGNKAKDMFIAWYLKDERSMLLNLKKSKVDIDLELFRSVPFHPYFFKPKGE